MHAVPPPHDAIPLIEAALVASERGELLDLSRLAADREESEDAVASALEQLQDVMLLHTGHEFAAAPLITRAGRQYLARRGVIAPEILAYLPIIDDLHGRQAVCDASSILVDEFRYQVLAGTAPEHARELVPPAFRQAVDEQLALNLFAAAVALTVRLAHGHAPGCVAEEVLALELIELATGQLETAVERRQLTENEGHEAARAIASGIFELCEDDDVLEMSDMREPSDAAFARHDPVKVARGVVDQRLESWFAPFASDLGVGYQDGPDLDHR
jgi:hypothetical protein